MMDEKTRLEIMINRDEELIEQITKRLEENRAKLRSLGDPVDGR